MLKKITNVHKIYGEKIIFPMNNVPKISPSIQMFVHNQQMNIQMLGRTWQLRQSIIKNQEGMRKCHI
jgi:hypothetical protein